MNHTLQKAIMDWLFDNRNLFGLHTSAVNEFRAYIYDPEGDYLIGGAQVGNFICQAIKLLEAN